MELFYSLSVLTVLAFAGPPVEVSTLEGTQLSGELTRLSTEGATLQQGAAAQTTVLQNILEIRFPAATETVNLPAPLTGLSA